jgi:hypothetical protein
MLLRTKKRKPRIPLLLNFRHPGLELLALLFECYLALFVLVYFTGSVWAVILSPL